MEPYNSLYINDKPTGEYTYLHVITENLGANLIGILLYKKCHINIILKAHGIKFEDKIISIYNKIKHGGLDYVVTLEDIESYQKKQSLVIDFNSNNYDGKYHSDVLIESGSFKLVIDDFNTLAKNTWVSSNIVMYLSNLYIEENQTNLPASTISLFDPYVLQRLEAVMNCEKNMAPGDKNATLLLEQANQHLSEAIGPIDIKLVDKTLFPFCYKDHWRLVVIKFIGVFNEVYKYKLYYYDSIYSEIDESLHSLLEILLKLQTPGDEQVVYNDISYEMIVMRTPKQEKMSGDCGVFLIKFIEAVIKDDPLILNALVVNSAGVIRQCLANTIALKVPDERKIDLPTLEFH